MVYFLRRFRLKCYTYSNAQYLVHPVHIILPEFITTLSGIMALRQSKRQIFRSSRAAEYEPLWPIRRTGKVMTSVRGDDLTGPNYKHVVPRLWGIVCVNVLFHVAYWFTPRPIRWLHLFRVSSASRSGSVQCNGEAPVSQDRKSRCGSSLIGDVQQAW
jgi:hypothetical protein